MKRTILVAICGILLISFAGCDLSSPASNSTTESTTIAQTTITSTTTSTTQTTTSTTTTKAPTTTTTKKTAGTKSSGSATTTKKKTTTTKKAVKFTDVQKTYYAINNGTVRYAPYDDAKYERRMKVGESIYVIAKGDNGWNKVKIGDDIRYVWYENLSTTKPTTKKTTLATTRKNANTKPSDYDNFNDTITTSTARKNVNGLLIAGHTAFEYYYFSKTTADNYVSYINKAGNQLAGKANVYDIVVPTAIGVMLPADVRKAVNSSEQSTAINYMYGKMNKNVKTVSILDILRSHNKEYLYFHTDHHWTARAAYYAYAEFMKVKGASPKALSSYETIAFDGFYGSFYSSTGLSTLKEDVCVAYYPASDTSMFFADSNGNKTNWHVIQNVSNWAKSSKYNTFIGGDNAFTQITNNSRSDGGNALVIKESFGNAFVPFLVDHYKHVYVVDYRYYTKMKLAKFVSDYKIKDVIFINNIGATRSASLVGDIGDFVG